MPTDSIQLQIVKNAGAPATGAVTAAFSDSIVLQLASSSGIRKVKYRIYEFPTGFAVPAGWTAEAANVYSVTLANGAPAPAFTLPAAGADLRGKYFFDAVGNDQRSNGSIVGGLRSKAQANIPFASGLEDIGYLESNEFDTVRQYVGPIKRLIRFLDGAILSGGGVVDHGLLAGLTDDDHPQYLRTTGARALTGDQSAGGHKITSLATPTAGTDAANKDYVDGAAGFSPSGTPVAGYVVKWNGSAPAWAPSNAYAITAFAAVAPILEIGATATNPAFTATHAPTPTTLLLTNTDNVESKNVVGTPTSFTSSQSYTKTTNNASVTFTATGSDGISAANRSAAITWRPRVYWGVAAHGLNTEAGIEGLATSELLASRVKTFGVNATGSLRTYFACPTSFGTPTFTVGGFSGGFSLVSSSITVTNIHGVAQAYQLWESDSAGLGSISVVAT
jgi:hypothetical protein